MAANIERIFQSFDRSTDSLSTLIELRTALSSVSITDLNRYVTVPYLRLIFNLLDTDNSEILEECCSILKVALQAWSPASTLNQFRAELEQGLLHPSTDIQCLCLKQLELVGEDEQSVLNWEDNINLVDTVIQLLASPDLSVAKQAQNVILNISRTSHGIDVLYGPELLSSLETALKINDTVKFRVYEVLISICKLSESALLKTQQTGLLQQLLNEVYKDDVLTQLNSLELLSDLTLVEHGLVFLDQAGVIKQLENLMSSCETDPMAGLLLPGLIKFFGGVAHFYPKEVCSGNKTFVKLLLDNLISNDRTLCSISIQTVGFIAKTTEGKLALDKLGNMFIDGLHNIGAMVKNAPTELREIALHSTANLISIPVSEQTSETCQISEKWFHQIDPNLLNTIMSIAKQPFPELRLSAHLVLKALAVLPWGQKKLNDFPGFNEYLLDRTTEKTKEGKESKFEIIRTIAESPTTLNIFGQPYYVQLKVFSLQGPFYVQTESQVAFEGE